MIATWTEERVEILKKLWESGLSCSQIAAELGHVSRNSVIGKVHRLGLSGRSKAQVAAPRQRKVSPSGNKMVQIRPRGNRHATALAEAPAVEEEEVTFDAANEIVVPMQQRLSLLDLTAATCHWPIGDPQHDDFRFCGGRALADRPYCRAHDALAHQPPPERRRQAPRR